MSSFLHSPFAIKLGLAFTTLTTVCLLYTTFSGYGTSVPLFAPKQCVLLLHLTGHEQLRLIIIYSWKTRGTIVHMVMFRYQPTLSQSTKNDVASAFLALKDSCRLPDGSRYIVSLDGGSFASPEGRGKGLEVSSIHPTSLHSGI